ncbi:MAG: hypothetical protein J5977_07580 [Fibrobacter sp.]|nr:hypothetical protein [Fibrobacter sp.]
MNRLLFLMSVATVAVVAALVGCAGERQGLVCDEMEYRLNTMTYSPDQRAYAEEELRVCREQEAEKKAAGAASRQSIYDRFAASDSTKEKSTAADNSNGSASEKASGASDDVSVSEALKDSSGEKTVSIYDRYKNVEPSAENAPAESPAAETAADTSAADIGNFQ